MRLALCPRNHCAWLSLLLLPCLPSHHLRPHSGSSAPKGNAALPPPTRTTNPHPHAPFPVPPSSPCPTPCPATPLVPSPGFATAGVQALRCSLSVLPHSGPQLPPAAPRLPLSAPLFPPPGFATAGVLALRGTLEPTVAALQGSLLLGFPLKFLVAYSILYHWLGGMRHIVWDHAKVSGGGGGGHGWRRERGRVTAVWDHAEVLWARHARQTSRCRRGV